MYGFIYRLLTGCITSRFLQHPIVSHEESLQGISEILQEVPPVGNLHGIRRTTSGTVRIGAGSISADNLDARVSLQPSSKGISRAIGQQINRTVALKVDQNRSI